MGLMVVVVVVVEFHSPRGRVDPRRNRRGTGHRTKDIWIIGGNHWC